MKIIHIGDIIGRAGRKVVAACLDDLKSKYKPDVVIANAENSASGFGVNKTVYDELIKIGIDCFTTGNHIWDMRELEGSINKLEMLVRPANLPSDQPGRTEITIEKDGKKLTIINLLGRVFMNPVECPFRTFDKIYEDNPDSFIFVDLHAEATSEKNAFGLYADGRAGAVVGTHTHIQTNDDRLLPRGTFYITDVGMCGGRDSIIGMKKDGPLRKFVKGMPARYEVQMSGKMVMNAVFFEFDETLKVKEYEKISLIREVR